MSIEVLPMFVAIEHEERKSLCDSVSRDDEVAGVVGGVVGFCAGARRNVITFVWVKSRGG